MPRPRLSWPALLGFAATLVLLSAGLAPTFKSRQLQTTCARQARDIIYRLLQEPAQTEELDKTLVQRLFSGGQPGLAGTAVGRSRSRLSDINCA